MVVPPLHHDWQKKPGLEAVMVFRDGFLSHKEAVEQTENEPGPHFLVFGGGG